MKRLESKKSYSWWWDSHISPKNSKWLSENLEEMDKLVKEMLRLIDEEGDSFAKKAEMYYQKRPELLAHVEDFYRMYRALAERYDNLTGELRDSMQSMPQRPKGSHGGKNVACDSLSPSLEHTPDQKIPKPKRNPSPRAAGFDVFLGSGGSSDISRNTSETSSSSSDSESDLDDVAEENGSSTLGQQQRIIDLERELLEMKQKLLEFEESSFDGSSSKMGKDDQDFQSKVLELEKELRDSTDRLKNSDEEIMCLREELEKKIRPESAENGADGIYISRIQELEEELAAAKERLCQSEDEILKLKQIEMIMQTDAQRIPGEKQASEEEHIAMLEAEIVNYRHETEGLKAMHVTNVEELKARDESIQEMKLESVKINEEHNAATAGYKHELEELRAAHKQCEAKISALEEAIARLKLEASNSHGAHLQEKNILQADIAELTTEIGRISREKSALELKTSEQEQVIEELQEEMAALADKSSKEKSQLVADFQALSESHMFLRSQLDLLQIEKNNLAVEKEEACKASEKHVEELNKDLDGLKLKLDMLTAEKEELDAKVLSLVQIVKCRDKRIYEMDAHLQQLHLEHVRLVKEVEDAKSVNAEMGGRLKVLEEEVERQRVVISDSNEGKREAIRQLCFSLDHYRACYQELRQALHGHRRPQTILAS